MAHYPYHIGQIVFYAKMLKNSEWESLSIPRNKSNSYNADKFSKEKSIKNFTDDELKQLAKKIQIKKKKKKKKKKTIEII